MIGEGLWLALGLAALALVAGIALVARGRRPRDIGGATQPAALAEPAVPTEPVAPVAPVVAAPVVAPLDAPVPAVERASVPEPLPAAAGTPPRPLAAREPSAGEGVRQASPRGRAHLVAFLLEDIGESTGLDLSGDTELRRRVEQAADAALADWAAAGEATIDIAFMIPGEDGPQRYRTILNDTWMREIMSGAL